MICSVKEFIIFLFIIALIVAIFFGILYATTPEDKPETYSVYGTVINAEKDNIIIVDDNGNYWDYYIDEPTQSGDLVRLIITDNATKEVEDDEILKIYNLTNLTRS